MRKSGHNAGVRCLAAEGAARSCRLKRMSHSGPERYVIVAISCKKKSETIEIGSQSGERERELTTCKFETRMGRQPIIIEPIVPVWISHQDCRGSQKPNKGK